MTHRRLTFNELLDRVADMRGERVEIALARPSGPTPLVSLRGRVGRLSRGQADEEGLVFVPFAEDGGTGLYLKAQDFTEAVDRGDFGLVVMSGGLQVSIELVG